MIEIGDWVFVDPEDYTAMYQDFYGRVVGIRHNTNGEKLYTVEDQEGDCWDCPLEDLELDES